MRVDLLAIDLVTPSREQDRVSVGDVVIVFVHSSVTVQLVYEIYLDYVQNLIGNQLKTTLTD